MRTLNSQTLQDAIRLCSLTPNAKVYIVFCSKQSTNAFNRAICSYENLPGVKSICSNRFAEEAKMEFLNGALLQTKTLSENLRGYKCDCLLTEDGMTWDEQMALMNMEIPLRNSVVGKFYNSLSEYFTGQYGGIVGEYREVINRLYGSLVSEEMNTAMQSSSSKFVRYTPEPEGSDTLILDEFLDSFAVKEDE